MAPPLVTQEEVFGVLSVDSYQAHADSPEDTQGKVLDANHKACQLLQRDKSGLVGRDVGALANDLRPQFEQSLAHWRAGQQLVFGVDLPVAPERVLPVDFRTKCIDYGETDERVNRDA